MTVHLTNGLVERVETALATWKPSLPAGFPCHTVASQIAECYENADGTSGFWIARPRYTPEGRPAARPVFEVMRADGTRGAWDALARDESELIADVLTTVAVSRFVVATLT